MSVTAREVEEAREIRDIARATFDARMGLMRGEIEDEGVGKKIAGSLGAPAKAAFDEALEIADNNRGIVAGTIAALALWIFRNPIIAWIEELLGPPRDHAEEYEEDFDDRDDEYDDDEHWFDSWSSRRR